MSEEHKETDWAYAAGLVDGEGCIAIVRSFVAQRAKYQYGVAVVVANRERKRLGVAAATVGRVSKR